MTNDQIERMNKVNELLHVIATTDRRFFNNANLDGGDISHFKLEKKLFFIDGYTHKRIYPYKNSKWRGFCECGTMKSLIQDLREWIITGENTNGKHGYGGLYSVSWGYSVDGMEKVIQKAKDIGYLDKDKPSFKDTCLKLYHEGHDWCLGYTIKRELGIDNF